MDVVSFIIPNRNGKDLNNTINNINTVYAALNKEIIVVNQNDDRPFMRGQCYNIGAQYSTGAFLALTDNDIYHLRCLPLFKIYSAYKRPIIGFEAITQLTLDKGTPIYGVTERRPLGFGAFTFLSKTDFTNANGFSNLYIGWGAEDRDFISRFENYIRVPQNLGHLTHPKRINTNIRNTELNHEFLKTAPARNKLLDGMKQTRWTEDSVSRDGNILNVHVSSITVCDSFTYNELLEKHYSIYT
jgi:hypothetical protein